ncbi:putative BRCT domain, BRCA1-associated, BRCT domain superfamily [Helianthus annuus]|uniref:BRCT domain, BRCA1-associated, BRCT domain superfamily n=1 Tax=Helianthus annuus TaxID=4232 RepID=A0A9K3EA94_HELAN|nr:putative BRCT domain, BRCA1-associated, BRCT domain superfamily [Helianthus annuus]
MDIFDIFKLCRGIYEIVRYNYAHCFFFICTNVRMTFCCCAQSMHLKSFQVKRRQNLGRKTLRKGIICQIYILYFVYISFYSFRKRKANLFCDFCRSDRKISKHLNPSKTLSSYGKNLVLCGSGLSSDEKFDLVDFASSSGAVVSIFRDNVTHVIAATDSKGAGARTYKLLMAILHGKWILTMGWVKACMEARKLVNEEPYEVLLDNHGSYGGPKEGRLRVQNNAPKLFNNLNFYFIGDFLSTYKADLLNLVTTAGGTVIETRDRLLLSSHEEDTKANVNEVTLVVYNADFSYNPGFEDETALKCRVLDEAEDLAQEVGCQVVPHIWILDSIACGLQPSIPRH